MKRLIVMLLVAGLVGAMPVLAAQEQYGHGHQDTMMQCMQQSESLQDKVKKIKTEIEKGNKAYTVEELQALEKKLKDINEFMDMMGKQ